MNLDTQRHHATTDVVDVVVVGTGAGGAPLLAKLAAAGLSVVALEAGGNRDARAFTPDEVAAADLYWLDERLSAGATRQVFGANNSGIGVGGSTLHWGAFVPRADPRDLRLRSEQGVGEDWPLTYDDLLPYYREVETFVGISGPAAYPWEPARRYPLPPVPRNAPAQAMARGCAALGIQATDAPAAVVSRDFQQSERLRRQACVNCGACHQGCRIGAKVSMDVTYLPAAVDSGAEIRPSAFAIAFERAASGLVTGVVYRQDGLTHRQRCKIVVLCAGAIETPRLLLEHGLCTSSGQVGRNYMAHVATQVWGTFDDEMRPNKGYPSSLISEDFVRATKGEFLGGYLLQSLGIMPVTWANQMARCRGLWGRPLVDAIDDYNHVAGLGINGECLPYADNVLELSDERDASGLRKPRVVFAYGENERKISAHAAELMDDIWTAAGARDIWSVERAAHTIGTCRMGEHADRAVVDPYGRSFDIANLWICDNSIFPSSLAANPALTIMALSLRTADAILTQRAS